MARVGFEGLGRRLTSDAVVGVLESFYAPWERHFLER